MQNQAGFCMSAKVSKAKTGSSSTPTNSPRTEPSPSTGGSLATTASTSPMELSSGSEISTLHVIETATANCCRTPSIELARPASHGKPDKLRLLLHTYPKKGDVASGQEMYNRHVFYHALSSDPAKDTLIFGEGLNPEWWPNLNLSEDGVGF